MSVPKSVHDAYKSAGLRVPAGASLAKNPGGPCAAIPSEEREKAFRTLQIIVRQYGLKGAVKLLAFSEGALRNVLNGHRRIGRDMAAAIVKHPTLTIVKPLPKPVPKALQAPTVSDDIDKLVAPLLEVINERDRLLARLSVIDGVLARINSAVTSTPRKLRAV